ncbi:MAG: SDR family NAD(P)-dependent oxidoreductase [Paramuribaculum sp.]|nr:SDR family NAD(P)-dependent oxidoreductase [Paramuribaculum sp.]
MVKRIIIVGASSGLGRRLALDYADRGYTVGICARREELLKAIAAERPGRICYAPMDVAAPDAEAVLDSLIESVGGMDLLLYCAGTGFRDPDLDAGRLDRTLKTNVDGFARIISSAYRYFRRRNEQGQIAAITSIAATKGIGVSAAYSASKRFEQTFLESIAQLARMQRVKVAVTDIRPGFIRTDLLDDSRSYPMLMKVPAVARKIERAIDRRRSTIVIDWRWRIVTALWRLIPRPLWVRLKIDF